MASFSRIAGLSCLVAALVAAPGAAATGRSLLQSSSYNTFPGCTFLADSPVLTNPTFSTLVAGLNAAGLTPLLEQISNSIATGSKSALTVLAPTNAAFAEYLAAENITAAQLLASPELRNVLLYHVVPQPYTSLSSFQDGSVLPTLLGGNNNLTISQSNGTIALAFGSEAQLSGPPSQACNILVYPIDEVLVPSFDLDVNGQNFMNYLSKQLSITQDRVPGSLIIGAVQQGQTQKVAAAFLTAVKSGSTGANSVIYSVAGAAGGIPVTAQILNSVYTQGGNSCTYVRPLLTSANMALAANAAGGVTSINSYLTQNYPTGVATCVTALPAAAGK